MKIHLRFNSYDEQHTKMTLFINGQNNGELCTSPSEADWLYFVIERGSRDLGIEFIGSGHNAKDGDPIRPLP